MSKASHVMPETDPSEFEPRESTVDIFDPTPQLAKADGKSTVSVDEVEGGERVTESVEHGLFDPEDVDTTEPSKRIESDAAEKKPAAKRAPRKTAAKATDDADKGGDDQAADKADA